jgi:hypothetical protein
MVVPESCRNTIRDFENFDFCAPRSHLVQGWQKQKRRRLRKRLL